MKWELRTLGDLGEWGSGGTPLSSTPEYYNGTIPWLIIEDLNDGVVTSSQKTITELGLKNSSAKIVEPGTLLIAMYGSIGKLGIAGNRCATNQAIAFCRHNPELVDVNFLFYYLLFSREKLLDMGKGNTQQNIGQAVLKEYPIPLPPLTEQKRIASLLARADRLRHLRRTAHDLSESLLQSVFLEMFYSTDTKWEQSLVEDLAKKKKNAIRTGPFGSQLLHSEFTEKGEVLVLGIDNAVQNEFSWGKPRFITREKYEELKRYTVFPGDLIITIMATNGRVAVVPNDIPLAINTKHLCCITLEQKICLPKFLQACMLYHPAVLKQMGGSERGAVMPGLNMEIIKNLVVPVPPLSLQEEFAGVVAQVESMRSRQAESERQVEGLFESLLAGAFNG